MTGTKKNNTLLFWISKKKKIHCSTKKRRTKKMEAFDHFDKAKEWMFFLILGSKKKKAQRRNFFNHRKWENSFQLWIHKAFSLFFFNSRREEQRRPSRSICLKKKNFKQCYVFFSNWASKSSKKYNARQSETTNLSIFWNPLRWMFFNIYIGSFNIQKRFWNFFLVRFGNSTFPKI